MAIDKKTLGNNLRNARVNNGITLEKVNKRTGLRASTVSLIENGDKVLYDIEYLSKLADLYGVSVEKLLMSSIPEYETYEQETIINNKINNYYEPVIKNIFGIDMDTLYNNDIPEDFEASVIYVLNKYLSKNEAVIFVCSLCQDKSFAEIGKSLDLTRERVRQLYNKAEAKLNTDIVKLILKLGLTKYFDDRINKSFKAGMVKGYNCKPDSFSEKETENPYLTKSIDILNLSIRSRNCLINNNLMFVGEVVKLSYNDILALPTVGEKCANEIIDAIKELGF